MTITLTSLTAAILVLIFFFIVHWLVKNKIKPAGDWNFKVNVPDFFSRVDSELRAICKKSSIENEGYEELVRYLITGVESYRSHRYARVEYPGVSGTRGRTVEGLEGFARTAPLLASWIHSGRPNAIKSKNHNTFDIQDHLFTGLVSGTSPHSEEYWGDVLDNDQRIVEAADIALTIWLLKDRITHHLVQNEYEAILEWINQVNGKSIYGGNWILFRILINSVLTKLNFRQYRDLIEKDYQEFKTFYLGEGWFSDGTGGAIDYYNVWQMHYMLFWLSEINPEVDNSFCRRALSEFCEFYQYFITPNGIPIFGRSCCYRLAAATPLILMSKHEEQLWSGRARRALDATFSYFIKNGALQQGKVTQGYFGNDVDLLENYSGRASPLWSLRSLIAAYYLSPDHAFWRRPSEPLPIEKGDFKVSSQAAGIEAEGFKVSGSVVLSLPLNLQREKNTIATFSRMSRFRRFLQKLLRRPLRISNYNAKYRRIYYYSHRPFFND